MNSVEKNTIAESETIIPKNALVSKIRGVLSVALLAVAANSCGKDKTEIRPEKTDSCIQKVKYNSPQLQTAETAKNETVCDKLRSSNSGSTFYITELKADGTISTTNPCAPDVKTDIACYQPKKSIKRSKKTPPTTVATTPPPANTTVIIVQPQEHKPAYTNEAIESYDEQTHGRY